MSRKTHSILKIAVVFGILFSGPLAEAKTFDVRTYGAVGDGKVLDTQAIQAAIDESAQAGGGIVCLSGGRFLSGTIYLKSNVALCIEAGAVLLGSKNLKDYPVTIAALRSYTDNYTDKSLIYAEKVENITLMGRGTIDGQGKFFEGPYKVRPYMIRLIECKNVTVEDLTLQHSAMWGLHCLACENVTIDGISIHSKVNHNNDGIDIDGCDKVRISNCEINSGDDAIVLKSTLDRVCKNIAVTNCVLSSNCHAFKCGTESNGGFQNITFSNSVIYDIGRAGIALELVDGGVFNRVIVSNINMIDVSGAIFIRLGNRARPYQAKQGQGGSSGTFTVPKGVKQPGMGSMSNIIISNVQAVGVSKIGCSITGLPGHPVENVTLENIRIRYEGGGSSEEAKREIPEYPEKYPNCKMFGVLPAYGFFVRHAENVRFQHIDLAFEQDDHRPALICDDVSQLKIFDFDAKSTASTQEVIRLENTNSVFIHGCQPQKTPTTFLRLEGERSRNVVLMNNDFTQVRNVWQKAKEVKENAVYSANNRNP